MDDSSMPEISIPTHDRGDVRVLDQHDPATAARIVAVQHAAYRVEADLIGFDGIPPLHDDVDAVALLELMLLGVIEEGEIAALIGYRRLGPRVDIDRLAVHPRFFRRGLARRLIAAVHRREADATHFDVSTGRDNALALALYRAMGYQPVADVALPEGVAITRLVREKRRD
jgi:ribosomal protein S18 acetylase RimI-like enzyme